MVFSKKGCPRCLPPSEDFAKSAYKMNSWTLDRYTGFTLKQMPNANAYLNSFRTEQTLKRGTLVRCVNCSEPWYQHPDQKTIQWLDETDVSRLDKWGSKNHALSKASLGLLKKIGSATRSRLEFPCIATLNGQTIHHCCLITQSTPPLRFQSGRLYFASEIDQIGISDQAAPVSLRLAWYHSHEFAMGASVVAVEDSEGSARAVYEQPFFVENKQDALKTYRVIKRSRRELKEQIRFVDTGQITWIFADPPEDQEDLILPGVPMPQKSVITKIGSGSV